MSQQPHLNKLGPLETFETKYESFLVSGFKADDFLKIGQKMHKITHNSMKNRGSALIFTNLVGVHPMNIHTELEANLSSCFGVQKVKKVHNDSDILEILLLSYRQE